MDVPVLNADTAKTKFGVGTHRLAHIESDHPSMRSWLGARTGSISDDAVVARGEVSASLAIGNLAGCLQTRDVLADAVEHICAAAIPANLRVLCVLCGSHGKVKENTRRNCL